MILISNPHFCLEPFMDTLEKIRDDFDGIELLAERYHGWDHREDIRDALSTTQFSVQVHAPLNDINTASVNPRMRDAALKELERCLELSSMIGSELVTIHPGFYSPLGRYWKDTKETSIKTLTKVRNKAEEYGLTVAIENMPELEMTMCKTPEETNLFLEKTGMEFCLDVGHSYTTQNLGEFLKFDQVNVHLHDNLGESDLHLPLGEGEIDFHQLLKFLKDYDNNYVIEGRSLEELHKSRDYLNSLISKL